MGLRPKTQNQLEELREENKRLREIVADLSELVLTQIAEQSNRVVPKPNKGQSDGGASPRYV
jgi:hypothetical protein